MLAANTTRPVPDEEAHGPPRRRDAAVAVLCSAGEPPGGGRRRSASPPRGPLAGVIGESPAMQKVCRAVERVAGADASVVLTGESGTGKEIVARALHAAGARRGRRFVAINCAAIPETLLEAELFGYERGAFTGAVKRTLGKIEHAHGGVLFLDEIGDLPPSLQGKLLRFLQERVIERIGGRKEIGVDVRVVCATHRDLSKLLERGPFREDLYYRVAGTEVRIPPSRERDGDAVLMARHFLARFGCPPGRRIGGYPAAALRTIDGHRWPGNVRELQNRVKRAIVMADGPLITPEDLDLDRGGGGLRRRSQPLRLPRARRKDGAAAGASPVGGQPVAGGAPDRRQPPDPLRPLAPPRLARGRGGSGRR
jgi:two-component system, NtrC family, response regulator